MKNARRGPPTSGWAPLVPELLVNDFAASLSFWCNLLGFAIAYEREDPRFVYLELQGAQIMLCERTGRWETAELTRPFGRGAMFQIYLDAIDPVLAALKSADWPIHTQTREMWRRVGPSEFGQREFFVQDPDGYLLMIAQNIGARPLAADTSA